MNKTKWLLLLLLGVAFYMMCASNPLRWDDMIYEYVWLDHQDPELLHPIDFSNRVDNFQEAFSSQLNHYVAMNGRFIVHFITQCFNGFIGKGLFNVINAFVYVLFLLLGLRYCNAQHSTLNAQHSTLFLIAGLWLLPPVQWIFSFDVVFAINYLWTATACISFILLFRSMSQKGTSSAWHNALLFLFALICGNLHEGYSLLISGALFFYALMHFRQLNASQWCLICGMWAGTLTVIGSPGIWGRASGASADSLQEALVRKLDILRYSKRLYLLIAALAAAYFMLGKENVCQGASDRADDCPFRIRVPLHAPLLQSAHGFPDGALLGTVAAETAVAHTFQEAAGPRFLRHHCRSVAHSRPHDGVLCKKGGQRVSADVGRIRAVAYGRLSSAGL